MKKQGEKKFRRMYFDIETSPNIVLTFNVGYNLTISPDNIIQERAIICICWRWEGEKKVHSLTWDKNKDDKAMLIEFMKHCNEADELIGHNGDRYDLPWIRTRCIYHGIPVFPYYQTIDTLKLSRRNFKFNSNKLDYISKFLGESGKQKTGGFELWKDITINNTKASMDKMVKYCMNDVVILQTVYNKLSMYVENKSHVGIHMGNSRLSCPHCASENTKLHKTRTTAAGVIRRGMECEDCTRMFTVGNTMYLAANKK